jgi:hypothetical protein
MRDLLATGKLTPVIDKRYSLREVPKVFRYLGEGHARGKVVITLAYNNKIQQRASGSAERRNIRSAFFGSVRSWNFLHFLSWATAFFPPAWLCLD